MRRVEGVDSLLGYGGNASASETELEKLLIMRRIRVADAGADGYSLAEGANDRSV